jgi:23S rRNA (pseudouridine1915-N3)-methyltransferase
VHIRLIAVGERQPSWVDSAFDDYAGRLPKSWRFSLQTIRLARRGRANDAGAAVAQEERKILAALRQGEKAVLLDEKGTQIASVELAARLEKWLAAASDLCFIIGGPDGVTQAMKERADFCWSLSRMTLPHGLARVMLVEQLYRAWAIGAGHPYHRE